MTFLTIILPLPPSCLSPNARAHYMTKAKATQGYRGHARWLAAQQVWRVCRDNSPRHGKASVSIQWFTRTMRHPDGDNALASLKAAFDGVTDSGFLLDDRGLYHEPITFAKDAKNPRVVLTFTAL